MSKRRVVSIPCVLLGLAVLLLPGPPTFGRWSIDDPEGASPRESSVKLDALGRPVIAFAGTILRLARWNGAAWRFEDVDKTECEYHDLSLALDGSGGPAISYYDYVNQDLEFARWNGSAWDMETVEGSGHNGPNPSLALDSAGNPVIGVRDHCNRRLRVARPLPPAVLYGGVVTNLSPGWRAGALPLDDSNDVVDGVFPLSTGAGGTADDTIDAPEPLVLYRILLNGTSCAGNVLRTVKKPGAVEVRF
jgi:hypothetical protein